MDKAAAQLFLDKSPINTEAGLIKITIHSSQEQRSPDTILYFHDSLTSLSTPSQSKILV